ncbi:Outer membrane protein OmpA [Nitrosomonas sp. Nm51]|uniref:OmpA family protein n=1 Tax=Nitrosomonas sp. Nm51 TaxID=133720 RepID=UPI0008BD95BD|nr:OmpA family protein [Nitrosomonas sp. Nm51]SER45795.1 Outer membrane protein OmpA [Nitrosomonas sp. Nm51]
MMKKTAYIVFLLVLLVAGCASQYSNRQLLELLDGMGFRTAQHDKGVVVFLPEVYFEFDSSRLTAVAQGKLSDISSVLTDPRASNRRILVEGHTDAIGSGAYNETLSLNRANAVADALVINGVDNQRVTRRGYGKKYPIAPNTMPDGRDNPEGRAQNRRVEIVVVDTN